MSGDGAGLQLDWACQRTCARERWGREMPDCSLSQAVHSALHPEKPWFPVSGRGFDSRHLHQSEGPGYSPGLPFCLKNKRLLLPPYGSLDVLFARRASPVLDEREATEAAFRDVALA